MPYKNAMEQTYDSGNFPALLEQGLKLADYAGFDRRAAESKARGKLRGRGLVTFLEWTSGNVFTERVTVDVSGDGFIEIYTATQGMGQGIATSYAQLVVDVFDVRSNGCASCRATPIAAPASAVQARVRCSPRDRRCSSHRARRSTGARARRRSARSGRRRPRIRRCGIPHRRHRSHRRMFELAARQEQHVIHVDTTSTVGGPSWPNGCHVCEVEVDPATGATQVASYMSLNDVGRVVNPMIVRGQLDGGAVQGIGQALCEEIVYDQESGSC